VQVDNQDREALIEAQPHGCKIEPRIIAWAKEVRIPARCAWFAALQGGTVNESSR
jgi:hypothetical protein